MHLPDFLFAEDEKEERGDFGFKLSELFHPFLDFIASSFAADIFRGGIYLLSSSVVLHSALSTFFFFLICFVAGDRNRIINTSGCRGDFNVYEDYLLLNISTCGCRLIVASDAESLPGSTGGPEGQNTVSRGEQRAST